MMTGHLTPFAKCEIYFIIDGTNGQRSPAINAFSHTNLADGLAETDIPEDHFILHVGTFDENNQMTFAKTALIHVNTFINNYKTQQEVIENVQ